MKRPPKIINLGLPKSGTTTLAVALRKAGLKVADWKLRPWQKAGKGFVGRLMYEGYFETGNPFKKLSKFHAIAETSVLGAGENFWPQTDFALISALRLHHPKAKFLLSYRAPDKQAASMRRWFDLGTERLPNSAVPGLPIGFGDTQEALEKWITGHNAFIQKIFENDPALLIFDIEDPDAPNKISAHIGIDLPWWGKMNANPAEDEK